MYCVDTEKQPVLLEEHDCEFHMSLGSVASEGKDAMRISNEPQRCVRGKRCRDECFWYDDRRALGSE